MFRSLGTQNFMKNNLVPWICAITGKNEYWSFVGSVRYLEKSKKIGILIKTEKPESWFSRNSSTINKFFADFTCKIPGLHYEAGFNNGETKISFILTSDPDSFSVVAVFLSLPEEVREDVLTMASSPIGVLSMTNQKNTFWPRYGFVMEPSNIWLSDGEGQKIGSALFLPTMNDVLALLFPIPHIMNLKDTFNIWYSRNGRVMKA